MLELTIDQASLLLHVQRDLLFGEHSNHLNKLFPNPKLGKGHYQFLNQNYAHGQLGNIT